ncbi:hypothetical protein [Candidatus Tisiphia endosymbiont of Nemotelus uliginosus]|uniref:hypothetical protein n=1 Tax=Candidatus Tisiphia endosymbiont of Nemotelus uliginosus TaxID=3077926 RepID=UPI0035C9324A
MQIEKVFNVITIVIAILYTAIMFNFLMKIEKQNLVKQQQDIPLNRETTNNKEQRELQNTIVLQNEN